MEFTWLNEARGTVNISLIRIGLVGARTQSILFQAPPVISPPRLNPIHLQPLVFTSCVGRCITLLSLFDSLNVTFAPV